MPAQERCQTRTIGVLLHTQGPGDIGGLTEYPYAILPARAGKSDSAVSKSVHFLNKNKRDQHPDASPAALHFLFGSKRGSFSLFCAEPWTLCISSYNTERTILRCDIPVQQDSGA